MVLVGAQKETASPGKVRRFPILTDGRGLAGEKGYELEKAPISGTWFLINEKTGKHAVSDRGHNGI